MTVWEVIGWTGQAAFFSRFFVQWLASERAKRSVAPRSFWWLSLIGAVFAGIYDSHIGEPVLLAGVLLNGCLYARNLWFAHRGDKAKSMHPGLATLAALSLAGVLVWVGLAKPREDLADARLWLAVSIVGQGIWSSRFVLQWWYTERKGQSHFPISFWWASLFGNVLLLSYAVHLANPILIAGYAIGPLVQGRNLWLEFRRKGRVGDPPGKAGRVDGRLLPALLLVSLGGLLYLPNAGTEELDDEEGRRAWTAREMLDSGDLVLPTIWGRPYLAKPPAQPWAVAAVATTRGGVDEWSTRLPSILATIATALSVYLIGRRMAGQRAAWIGGALFLVTIEVFNKGAFGELEAVLAMFSFLAAGLAWRGARDDGPRGTIWSVLSGLALGGALLTKGPPGLLFFGAALLGLAFTEPGARRRAASPLWLPLVIGLATAGIWVALLLARTGVEETLAIWRSEMIDRGSQEWGGWFKERGDLLIGVAGGFFPGSLVLIVLLRTRTLRTLRVEPCYRFMLWTMALSMLVLLASPGVRSRYAYPLAPWCALAAGWAVDRAATAAAEESAVRRLRWVAFTAGGMGVILAVASCVLPFRPIQGVGALGPAGYVLAIGAGVLGGTALFRRRSLTPLRAIAVTIGILSMARLVQTIEVTPVLAGHRERRVEAARLEELLPDSGPLFTTVWGHFNELFYLEREIVFVERPRDVSRGVPVLVRENVARRLRSKVDTAPEVSAELTLGREPLELVVWR